MYYDLKQSGERIRQLRIRGGYTQETLAKELNIDRSFYSKIESGKHGCSVDLLVQLSLTFHVSLDFLVFGNGKSEVSMTGINNQLKLEIEALTRHLEEFKLQL